MKQKLKSTALLFVSFVLFACQSPQAVSYETVTDFTPIIDNNGADPWILQQDNQYYYTKTTGNNVMIWRSESLSGVAAGEEKIIWEAESEFNSVWAPEIHYLDNQWVAYFAADRPGEPHRMYALVNQETDPFEGSWELEEIQGMDDKFAIDGTVFEANGKRYFVWSGWEGYQNGAQNLYIAEMGSPVEIVSERALISEPEYDWEKRQYPLINEGPEIIIENDTVNLVYSASGSWDNDYTLGLLTASADADLLEAESWKKDPEPIFSQTDNVFGPGHNGFAVSPNGKENWLVFHSARWNHSGWDRSVRLQPFSFQGDKIQLAEPASSNERLGLPSGEKPRMRFEAADGKWTEGLQLEAAEGGLYEKAVAGFEDPADYLEMKVEVEEAGEKIIAFYVKTVDYIHPENIFNALLTLNDEEFLVPIYPSEYFQPVQIRVNLEKGINQIQFSSEIGVDQLLVDRMEIF